MTQATAKAGARRISTAYRLYEVQNGNHIETYQDTFPQLELIQPQAQRAFDLLVQHVERREALPPSQCIPRGGSIAVVPTQPGHCAERFSCLTIKDRTLRRCIRYVPPSMEHRRPDRQ